MRTRRHGFRSSPTLAVFVAAVLVWSDALAREQAIARARAVAAEVIGDGLLPGVTVGLVDGQELVWVEPFGLADLEKRTPMARGSIFRVGSISKLFTALSVMQLVERGKLDLSRPLVEVLPEFKIQGAFPEPVRLRHLLSHVSGLPRESPVGSYFDGSGAGPAQALASMREASMVHPPAKVTKYSNIGVSLLGNAVEKGSGESYVAYVTSRLLEPLGMRTAAFERKAVSRDARVTGYMQEGESGWTRAPEFELATIAAGNLYAGIEDLARLARLLHAGGEIEGKRIIAEETLLEMSRVQFPEVGGKFGLGFVAGNRGGERSVEHSGAVYGFTTSFVCLPDRKLTAIILTNGDVCMGPVRRITRTLIDAILAEKKGKTLPAEPEPVGAGEPLRIPEGKLVFRTSPPSPGGQSRLELRETGGKLSLGIEGHAVPLQRTAEGAYRARGRILDGNRITIERGEDGLPAAITLDGHRFGRHDPARAPRAPERWADLEGSYGPAYLPVRIRILEGRLVAECETFEYEPEPRPHENPGEDPAFLFPRGTMYEDELLVFRRGSDGKVASLKLGTIEMSRLPREK